LADEVVVSRNANEMARHTGLDFILDAVSVITTSTATFSCWRATATSLWSAAREASLRAEAIPIQKVNEAYERFLKSDVKYRISIDMASLKSD